MGDWQGNSKISVVWTWTLILLFVFVRLLTYPFRLIIWLCTSKYKRDPNPPSIAIK